MTLQHTFLATALFSANLLGPSPLFATTNLTCASLPKAQPKVSLEFTVGSQGSVMSNNVRLSYGPDQYLLTSAEESQRPGVAPPTKWVAVAPLTSFHYRDELRVILFDDQMMNLKLYLKADKGKGTLELHDVAKPGLVKVAVMCEEAG